MAKPRTIFFCSNCGASSPKWLGKCPHCNEWNTYQEELIQKETATEEKRRSWAPAGPGGKSEAPKAVALRHIETGRTVRLVVNKAEHLERTAASAEFYALGLGEPVPISGRTVAASSP